ncbi:MAG: tetratricopeptide repeat protein [Acidobacteriota bacterium]|nr:tetratricopeptide repeat protein [Acidobacteriota bacterium]
MRITAKKQAVIYRFGCFQINAGEGFLLREGEIVPLTPKIFEMLLLLVENNGRMLSKDEIMETVWADSFVEETNLTSNISRLRKILHAGGEEFIETFPKRGYRFRGEVETVDAEIVLSRRVTTHVRQVVEEFDDAPEMPEYAAALETLPNNLTLPNNPIVGREKEILEIENLLRGNRLITLTGIGGTGKTRLAQEIACRMLSEFADGVFFIALAAVRNAELVASEIANTLGVKESGGKNLMRAMRDFLGEKKMLLVVDNFEQIVSAAPVLAELLAAASDLKILATSRALLHLKPEREFIVPPLALPPDLGLQITGDKLQIANRKLQIEENESVKLFTERAQAIKSNFSLTEDNAEIVAEICRRLEGLPLAIELAAARIKILSPPQILERLENRLKLLTGGAKDLPARQQTIRGTIEWSYDLLDEIERVLFERLAVFAGGFTIEAVESVVLRPSYFVNNLSSLVKNTANDKEQMIKDKGQLTIDILNGITSLVENSLLVQTETAAGESRFRLLQVVREYGLERLAEKGELEEMRRSHAEFFLNLATTAQPQLIGAEQTKWLSILETEHDNLRAALAWSFEHDAETTLRLARALGEFWYVRGHLSEGSANFREVLSRTTDLLVAVRGEALVGAGILEQRRGDVGKSRELFTEARAVGEKVGDADIIATALNGLGIGAAVEGDETAARAFLEEGLRVSQAAKNQRYIGLFLNNLGEHARRRGDYAEARRLYAESLIIQRELGNTRIVAIALGNLGRVSYLQNDFAAARKFYTESLEISRSLGDLHSIALLLDGFAGLAADAQPERAAKLLGAANALRGKVGSDFDKADADFYERIYQTVKDNLAKEDLAKHLSGGGALKLEQAVSLALDV